MATPFSWPVLVLSAIAAGVADPGRQVPQVLVSFTSPAEVATAFHEGAAFSAIVVLAMAVTLLLLSRASAAVLRVKVVAWGGILLFGCLLGVSYWSTYGRFVAAEVSPAGVKLHYLGPFGEEVVLQRGSIRTVVFGLPGKLSTRCYIRIEQKSGASYRSATLYGQADVCKGIRQQMLATLSL